MEPVIFPKDLNLAAQRDAQNQIIHNVTQRERDLRESLERIQERTAKITEAEEWLRGQDEAQLNHILAHTYPIVAGAAHVQALKNELTYRHEAAQYDINRTVQAIHDCTVRIAEAQQKLALLPVPGPEQQVCVHPRKLATKLRKQFPNFLGFKRFRADGFYIYLKDLTLSPAPDDIPFYNWLVQKVQNNFPNAKINGIGLQLLGPVFKISISTQRVAITMPHYRSDWPAGAYDNPHFLNRGGICLGGLKAPIRAAVSDVDFETLITLLIIYSSHYNLQDPAGYGFFHKLMRQQSGARYADDLGIHAYYANAYSLFLKETS